MPSSAQNTNDPRGQVLRYNSEGTVPPDNPFGAGNWCGPDEVIPEVPPPASAAPKLASSPPRTPVAPR